MPIALLVLLSLPLGAQPVDVLMSQYNPERTGTNSQERILRPGNVNPTLFGKIGQYAVDHSVYALPLIVNGVDVGGGVRKNLVFIATMANSVYAFDADVPGGEPVWRRNLGTAGAGDEWIGLAATRPYLHGILSTPVIDRATNTIYLVARTDAGGGASTLQLHALDLGTGTPKFNSPRLMTFPTAGGDLITVNSLYIQRAGLLLNRGMLYVAVAGVLTDPNDVFSQEGYVQSFDATDLSRRLGSFQVTPNGQKGGIWQAGRGISVDEQGAVYVATAGGFYDGRGNYGSSIVKLNSGTLTVADWFTPSNYDYLYHNNIDPSANGVTLIPGTGLAFAGGKEGVLYLLDRNNMGKNSNGALQQFAASGGCGLTDCSQSLGTAFWHRPTSAESFLYVWDKRDLLREYTFRNGDQRFTTTATKLGPTRIDLTGGPSVSSLGEDQSTGIVWSVTIPCCPPVVSDSHHTLVPATLRAYRASDITQELYNSDSIAADSLGFLTKFAPPVVANGRVYVPTHSNKVVVYGLRDPKSLTVNVSGNGTVSGTPGGIQCGAGSCNFSSDAQSTIQLTAIPAAGSVFSGWSGACTGTGACSVAMSTNRTVTATFVAGQTTVRLDVTKSGSGSGTVAGNGVDCGSVCSVSLTSGTVVTLVAAAAQGSSFSGWTSGPCAGSAANSCTFAAQSDVALAASFALVSGPATSYHFLPVNPCRAVDTRNGGGPIAGQSSRTFTFQSCGAPALAAAVALNVTVVPQEGLGYLSIWPAGASQPLVSTLNSLDGRIKANAAIVGMGTNGGVSVFVTNSAHVVLDVFGYFVPKGTAGALAFYPTAPCRVVDSRLNGGSLAGNETRRVNMTGACLPAQAQAYSLNVTAVPSGPLAYLTLWPVGVPQPLVSTLNNFTGTIVANAAIVPSGAERAVNAFVTNPSHLVIDANGYFAPPGATGGLAFVPVAPCRLADTRNAAGALGGPSLAASSTRDFPLQASSCGVPGGAQAFVLNATVVPPSALTYLTLWPGNAERPLVSTLNAIDGALTSNAAIVGAGPGGVIRAFASDGTHLVLDISGYFVPE